MANKMYAIAYKYESDSWVDFKEHEDTMHFPKVECFLPSREMAKEYISKYISESGYLIVEIDLISLNGNTIEVEYKDPWDFWAEGETL